jgi:hypothetical protein
MVCGLFIYFRKKGTSYRAVIYGMVLYLLLAVFHGLFLSKWLGFSAASVNTGSIFFRGIIQSPSTAIILTARHLLKSVVYLGFLAIPFQPLIFKRIGYYSKNHVFTVGAIIIATVSLFAICVITDKFFPFGGNILMNIGIGPLLLYDVETIHMGLPLQLPKVYLVLITIFSFISFSCSLLYLWISIKTNNGPVSKLQFMIFFAAVFYMIPMLFPFFFDRYLLFPSVILTLLLCYSLQESKLDHIPKMISILLILCFGWFTVTSTHDYMELNRTRYSALKYLREQNISMNRIDAGLEHNGWFGYRADWQAKPGKSWWVTDDEYKITLRKLESHQITKHFTFYRWLNLSTGDVFILRYNNPVSQ